MCRTRNSSGGAACCAGWRPSRVNASSTLAAARADSPRSWWRPSARARSWPSIVQRRCSARPRRRRSSLQVRIGSTTPASARACYVRADGAALPFADAFDAVLSTATFHWILDHDQLFASIYRALAPGGRLVAQCGGGANLGRLLDRADSACRGAGPRADRSPAGAGRGSLPTCRRRSNDWTELGLRRSTSTSNRRRPRSPIAPASASSWRACASRIT